jgi:hypothetical protein
MTKFMLKCFALVALLLFGVLLGIQKAHLEMIDLKGLSNKENTGSIIQTSGDQKREKDAHSSSHDLKTKQETLAKVDSFNIFSALGKKLTSCISSAFSAMVSVLGTIIQGMLAVFSP